MSYIRIFLQSHLGKKKFFFGYAKQDICSQTGFSRTAFFSPNDWSKGENTIFGNFRYNPKSTYLK